MNLSSGSFTYDWQSDWADVEASEGHAHHGLTLMPDGNILTGHAELPRCLVLDTDGNILKEFDVPTGSTHGLCCAEEEGETVIWIADIAEAQVVKCSLEGELLGRLTKADFPLGEADPFCPTAVAVDPATGELWVADGYGSHTVHCFTPELKHKLQLDGAKGNGAFNEPHWVMVDTRKEQSRIYVADRRNDCVQVFFSDGEFSHAIEQGLHTPSVLGVFGDHLVIGELEARIHIANADDQIVATLGDGRGHVEKPGWPNRLDAEEKGISPLDDIPAGEFNSPHGVCADAEGNIYISEWLLGDRYTKLCLTSSGAPS